MPILKNCKLFFCKLDPKFPNRKYNKDNPTWEAQIRTEDRKQKAEWEALGLAVKAVIPDDENQKPFYRVNLRKKSIKKDGTPSGPVNVVNGSLEPVDPNSIGNGSLAHIRIYQYPYNDGDGGQKLASVLMGIQLKKHIKYVPSPRDDEFDMDE